MRNLRGKMDKTTDEDGGLILFWNTRVNPISMGESMTQMGIIKRGMVSTSTNRRRN